MGCVKGCPQVVGRVLRKACVTSLHRKRLMEFHQLITIGSIFSAYKNFKIPDADGEISPPPPFRLPCAYG